MIQIHYYPDQPKNEQKPIPGRLKICLRAGFSQPSTFSLFNREGSSLNFVWKVFVKVIIGYSSLILRPREKEYFEQSAMTRQPLAVTLAATELRCTGGLFPTPSTSITPSSSSSVLSDQSLLGSSSSSSSSYFSSSSSVWPLNSGLQLRVQLPPANPA